jgi:hypothetical protein
MTVRRRIHSEAISKVPDWGIKSSAVAANFEDAGILGCYLDVSLLLRFGIFQRKTSPYNLTEDTTQHTHSAHFSNVSSAGCGKCRSASFTPHYISLLEKVKNPQRLVNIKKDTLTSIQNIHARQIFC